MKILLIGNYLSSALKQLGETVLQVGFGDGDDICTKHPLYSHTLLQLAQDKGFSPDAFLYCDLGNFPLVLDPQNLPIPSIWYSIDTYCNPWHINYGHGFDKTLVAQKDFIFLFTKEGIDAQWFPLFCQSSHIIPYEERVRDIPISFVGTLGHKNNPDRKPFLQSFRAQFPLVIHSGSYAEIFARSHIVLNQTAFSEVNFRCFEAIAMGAALLMEKCQNGLSSLFVEGVEILPTYLRNNVASAVSIAKYALEHKEHLASIARAGQKRLCQEHTDLVRAKKVIELFTNIQEEKSVQKRLENLKTRAFWVQTAFAILASDLPQSFETYKDFFLEIAQGHHPVKNRI